MSVVETAVTAAAVIKPFSAFNPSILEVNLIDEEEEVEVVRPVLKVSLAASTLPPSPAETPTAWFSRVSPWVPSHGQGRNAERPSVVATGPASALANVA
jgi:hypothetical protein